VVLLEAPHRIAALARALAALGERRSPWAASSPSSSRKSRPWPPRPARLVRGRPRPHARRVRAGAASGGGGRNDGGQEGERVLRLLLAELPVKTAVKLAAEISGAPRNALYETALRIRNDAQDNDTDSE
jgi:16S rRNA (cytidine1402-2'-O)-methyltransferase